MNKKITLPELADLVCDASGLTKKETEAFLNDLFDVIEEHLYTDKQVKIKGLGTFKLTTVEERKSVDVNNGQPIVIPAHGKVTFTPDAELKTAVNKPYESLQSVFLDDVKEEELTPFDPEEEQTGESASEEETMASQPEENPVITDQKQVEETLQVSQPISAAPTKTYHGLAFWSGLLVGITLVCAFLFLAWNRGMLNFSPDEATVDMLGDHLHQEASQPALSDSMSHLLIDQQDETDSSAPVDQEEVIVHTHPTKSIPIITKSNPDILATEIIGEGTTLSTISRKYYGNKAFWVYIFQANSQKVKNPNRIPIGTRIIVPKPDPQLIDKENPSLIEKAQKIQDQYNLQYR